LSRQRDAAAGVAAAMVSLAFVVGGCGGSAKVPTDVLQGRPSARADIPTGTVAANFTLEDASRRRISLAAQRGKVVLLSFLYTHCVDVCPGIAHELNDVLRRLGPKRRQVRVIAVSVDPVFDTRAAVRRFSSAYDLLPEFHYLIGSRKELRPVWQAYNVLVEPRSTDLLSHSAPIYLIDRRGVPRYAYPALAQARAMLPGVRELVANTS
jgi:cytochrome oxidase Cu insertion factor (SCO1/SenC/PrrC family)